MGPSLIGNYLSTGSVPDVTVNTRRLPSTGEYMSAVWQILLVNSMFIG
jgi:hypothetical protein